MTPQRVDARIERRIRATGGVGGERAGDEARLQQPLGLEESGQGIGGGELGAVEERQPLLGAEHDRRETGLGQRLGGRHALAPIENLADADHRRRHMGERREVARSADRALARHHRHQVLRQHGLQQGDGRGRDAGGALRQAGELQHHHQPGDGGRHRLADAGSMGEHDIALQPFQIGVIDADAGQPPEAGIDAVNRLALGEDGLHRRRARRDRAGGGRVQHHIARAAPINAAPIGQRHGTRCQNQCHSLSFGLYYV